ncbi:MAG: hypothetical protein ACPGQL_06820 [Thermoplasmatota archaeon]
MRFPLALTALLLVAGLAGCLADDDTDPADATPVILPGDAILDEGEGHDHRDPAQHRHAWNAQMLDTADLRDFGWHEEIVVGAHAMAIYEDTLAVAVNGGDFDDGQQGFHLFDVSDPADMVHLGFWDAGVPVNGDRTIAFSDDGETVFLGFEGSGVRPGVVAVDVRDPAQPVEVAFWDDPQDFGSHTIGTATIAGQQYVFSLALGVNILRYNDPTAGGDGFTLVGKYLTADQLAALDAAGFVAGEGSDPSYAQTYALRTLYGHDMQVYVDPDTQRPLLLVAYAYEGLKVLDVSVPSVPVPVARWMPPQETSHKHYTHSVAAERASDGRLILVVGSETFEDQNAHLPSPIWIVDATAAVLDPAGIAEPEHLGTWSNPSGAAAGALGLSVHFFRIQDGLLYLSHYHGGVWGIDLRDDDARRDPQAFAYSMAVPADAISPPEECCIGWDLDGAPMVFDVEVGADGTVYVADLIQGVSSLRFDAP